MAIISRVDGAEAIIIVIIDDFFFTTIIMVADGCEGDDEVPHGATAPGPPEQSRSRRKFT